MRIALVRINARRSSLYLSGSTRAAARARARPPARPLRHGALAYPLRNGQTEIFAACARLLCIILNNLPSSSSICLQQHKYTTLCPCWGAGCEAARKLPRRPEVQQKEEARGGKGPARLQAPRRVAQLRRYQTQRSDQAGGGIGDGEQDFLVGKAADVVPEPRAGDRLQNRPCRRSCRKQLLKESGD
ncbi:uncharacterized protein [Struthio camelus]|uniref:uncharacterized protein isoform X5 n=1 Tax=Struthio camelus TaxID=8801 RepID=UPI003603EB7A